MPQLSDDSVGIEGPGSLTGLIVVDKNADTI